MSVSTFVFDWKMDWKEFETLRDRKEIKSGLFIVSKNNIPFLVELALSNAEVQKPHSWFILYCRLEGGYKEFLLGEFTLVVKLPNGQVKAVDLDRGYEYGPGDKNEFQRLFNLTEEQPLIFRFTFMVDDVNFTGAYCNFPALHPAPGYIMKLYDKIQKPPTAADFLSQLSDVKLSSSDGVQFYGHRSVLAAQSDTLTTLFSRSAEDGNEENIFSVMHSTSLKLLLQFIYTGVLEFVDLKPDILVNLLDAGERYDLATLKEACISVLESQLMKNAEIAPIVINAAHTYNLKTLKLRAIDVLVDNYHKFEESLLQDFHPKLLSEIVGHSMARTRVHQVEC